MKTQSKKIPKGWEEVRLGGVADIKSGKRNAQDAKQDGLYPLFDRSKEIKRSDKYLFDDFAVIVAGEGKEFFPRYYAGKFDLHQRAYAIYNFTDDVFGLFVYYVLYSRRKYFEEVAVGSTVKSLRLNHFQDFLLPLPRLKEQKKIAEVLGVVDEEIRVVGVLWEGGGLGLWFCGGFGMTI